MSKPMYKNVAFWVFVLFAASVVFVSIAVIRAVIKAVSQ